VGCPVADARKAPSAFLATIITGFDRHSVRSATQKIAYVAASRGREDIEVFVESVADLSQIQNRTGDRKAVVEMAFEDGLGDRAEAKRLFRHLQRLRAAKAERAEPERAMDLCRQAAEPLEREGQDQAQSQTIDLQQDPLRVPDQASHEERQMTDYERELWERAAAKDPSLPRRWRPRWSTPTRRSPDRSSGAQSIAMMSPPPAHEQENGQDLGRGL